MQQDRERLSSRCRGLCSRRIRRIRGTGRFGQQARHRVRLCHISRYRDSRPHHRQEQCRSRDSRPHHRQGRCRSRDSRPHHRQGQCRSRDSRYHSIRHFRISRQQDVRSSITMAVRQESIRQRNSRQERGSRGQARYCRQENIQQEQGMHGRAVTFRQERDIHSRVMYQQQGNIR